MTFFKEISELGIAEIKMTIINNPDGTQTVYVPINTENVKDSAVKTLKPFSVTDSPAEIDKDFFTHFSSPLINANTFISNIRASELRIEEQKKNTDLEKSKREKAKKLNDTINSLLDNEEFDTVKDVPKVKRAIQKLEETFPNDKNIKKAKEKLIIKSQTSPTFFD